MELRKLFFLPELASAHGHEIDILIYLMHLLMLILFVGWAIFFVTVLFRFNRKKNPKANYHGVHNHTSTAVEIIVAAIEALLLIGFSIPFWAKQVNAFPDRADKLEVRVVGEQFAWNFHYPGKDGKFGRTDIKFFNKESNPLGIDPNDPNSKDDFTTINQLYVPIGHPIVMHLSSKDVIHCFSLPVMRVKQDAIPGLIIPFWFTPTKTGTFDVGCAQLCGIGHYKMHGSIHILTQEEYDKWTAEQASANQSNQGGGDDFWN